MKERLRSRLGRVPPGYRHSIGRILAVYSGLTVTVLLASLDQTIVATALPRIVSDLGGLSKYSWVFTAYLLTSTVTIPIWGKLGDVHGRRRILISAVAIFLGGSALCGLAQDMTQLVIFRALQGLGAGGLIPLAMATVGHLVPPRDRGRYQGIMASAFAVSAVMGPAVGGLIVDHTTWRWIFYANLPLGGLALVVVMLTMPRVLETREHSIDYLGGALLSAGVGSLLLALVWGGREYPWSSPQIVAAFAGAAALLGLFALVERSATETILPFDVMRDRLVATSAVCTALAAMCLFGVLAFVPLFVQSVIGTSATSSGVVLTPLMLSNVLTSTLTGQLISRTGRYRACALIGPCLLCAGLFLLWRMDASATTGEVTRNLVVVGCGMGLIMPTYMVSSQNAVSASVIGAVTSLVSFARALGTTFGVTVFGLIVNQGLPAGVRGEGTVVHRLPPALRAELADALHPAFLFGMVVAVVILCFTVFGFEERPLRRSVEEPVSP